jgi:hypothetical protein
MRLETFFQGKHIHPTPQGVIHVTINGLFVKSPKELSLPRNLAAHTPIFECTGDRALAGVNSVSFDDMSAQVMIIVEPDREVMDVAIYGDPNMLDTMGFTVRDHLALSGGQPYSDNVTDEYKVLFVLRVSPRLSISTYQFRGLIGIGGSRCDYLSASLGSISHRDCARLHVEHVAALRSVTSRGSILTADAVTASLTAEASEAGATIINHAYGAVDCRAKGASRINVRSAIATHGKFAAHNNGQILFSGIVTDGAEVEQHGTGLLAIEELRVPCEPKITGAGSISINGRVYTNKVVCN